MKILKQVMDQKQVWSNKVWVAQESHPRNQDWVAQESHSEEKQ